MLPTYEENQDRCEVRILPTSHFSPHLHASLEVVQLLEGSYTLGCGIDLFPMKPGDVGIIFPGLIHHFHVFDGTKGRALHLLASPSFLGTFSEVLTTKRPVTPLIPKELQPSDIPYALSRLAAITAKGIDPEDLSTRALLHAFVQIVLAQSLPRLSLYARTDEKDQDPVYRTVSYIAAHFQEDLTLTGMARDLGISPYALSRIFSGTFHQNFNHYVNEVRLLYVTSMLRDTDRAITEIAYEAGFQSQATFNRVFQARYHCSPRAFRNAARAESGA